MNHSHDYWQRQLAHCDEVLALCERAPTGEQVADAEAVLAARARAPQAELNLKSP